MSIIRWIADRLKDYINRLWHDVRMNMVICTNCGLQYPESFLVSCRMVDRCMRSQDGEIMARHTHEQLQALAQTGKRVFCSSGRPLCHSCAEANSYICYVCELEKSLEASK